MAGEAEDSLVWADVSEAGEGVGQQETAVVLIGCAEGWVIHYRYERRRPFLAYCLPADTRLQFQRCYIRPMLFSVLLLPFFDIEMVSSIAFWVLWNQPLPLCPVAPSLKHIIGPWISFTIAAFRITFAQVYMGPFSKLKSTSCGCWLPLGSSCDVWGWGSVARLNLNDWAL